MNESLSRRIIEFPTLVELLQWRALHHPEQQIYNFLLDGEAEISCLTYRDLDCQAQTIGALLQTYKAFGERALLLYPPGLEFIAAFFGCLYAGVIAIPAYPPQVNRSLARLRAIAIDAQARVVLTTASILSNIESSFTHAPELEAMQWYATDDISITLKDNWQKTTVTGDSLAFLQYTSGSTATPKGVMISHSNVLHNLDRIHKRFEHTSNSRGVIWLPFYHDMGLIGGLLQPLYSGFPVTLLSPRVFLQRPLRWLQAISRYKATTSGGPNFAYDFCVRKISPEERVNLDLSSWDVAFSGAEPIHYETLEQFATTFKDCGFRREAFYPCYGLAEATLFVSGGKKADPPTVRRFENSAFEQNHVVEVSADCEDSRALVGCGQSLLNPKICIADPVSLSRCLPDQVGEVWVSNSSVAQGYWKQPEQTKYTFEAYLSDTGEGPFLRTGDLGFLHNGELFITGRAKDLIIIRGRNLYPQDIELTAERSHPWLRASSNAAFSLEIANEERLVVIQELEFRAKPNLDEVVAAIRQAVSDEHQVQVYAVVLIKPGSILKTSSGKIQRHATKANFLANKLEIVSSSILNHTDFQETENRLQREMLLALTPHECQLLLESYLQKLLAQVLSITPHTVNPQRLLSSLGLDSIKIFELKNRIEVDLKVAISIADFFEDLSLRALATKILADLTSTASESSQSLTPVQKTTEVHPLSFAQQRLWFINQLTADTPTYNIPIIINLTGDLNVPVLEQSLNEIIRRHHILRTNFTINEGKPVQVIKPIASLTLPVEDLREFPESESATPTLGDRTKEVQRLSAELAQQPFDLSCEPLWCAKLLRLATQEYKLLLTLHHIVADGWSIRILIEELAALYEAFSKGKLSPLPELPIQYVDFAYWQKQWLQTQRSQPLLEYWKQQLGGKLPVLNLPTDRPRSPIQTFKGAQAKLVLPSTLSEDVKRLSHEEGATLFMTLLAAFKTLLYRYTGQKDILVGSPIASRNRAEIEPLIGFFVNVLVLRTNVDGKLSFKELLSQVKSTALASYVHQDLPFEKLVEELQPERDLSYNPLFQVMFVLQNVPLPTPKLSDISITCQEGYNGTAKFDLTLFMEDREQGLVATVEYNTDLFHADTMNRMLRHFQIILEGIVANRNNTIANLPLLMASERQQLIVEWNNTQTDYPLDLCIHHLFEQQVERTPDAIALSASFSSRRFANANTVVFEKQQLTYRELNNQANQLANYLQEMGVEPEGLVGICMERSIEMVVGLLAILKAGGAYLPLDPAYPKERLSFMLTDAKVSVLLTQQSLTEKLPIDETKVIYLDTNWERIAQENPQNFLSKITSDNLAYAIYTSGSTGRPKGVAIEHHNTVALLDWAKKFFPIEALAGVLASTSICFDLSVFELFVPLICGGKVILAENALHLPTSLVAEELTLINTVPTAIAELLRVNGISNSVHTINLAGEPLQNKLVQQLYQQDNVQQIFNLYGPSEDTTYSTVALLHKGSSDIPPIGRPIANTEIYLLDQFLQLVPVGIPGELYIGSAGLARNYLNAADLTAEKFVPNPFSHKLGARLYKTGDLARYRADGNIEFLGRIDHQVKVRGYRIELGEIEKLLAQHPKVRETVVLQLKDLPGDGRLVAYVVSNTKTAPSTSELRKFLKEQLPEYMVPSAFVLLEALPLTANGKVDRRALPVPDGNRPQLEEVYVAPRSEMERAITAVWQEVLHLEKVGINDNFFDIGGQSLLMVQVNHKLQEILNRNLSIVEMFQHPTINSLSQYLSLETENVPSFQSVRERSRKQIDALKQQKRLFMKD